MFKELLKNKRAQNTAEYALLIALVVAGVIAMQTYAQRSLQARMRDAAQYMAATTNFDNSNRYNSVQYEPYYKAESFSVNSEKESNKRLGKGVTAYDSASQRNRSGFEATGYGNGAMSNLSGL